MPFILIFILLPFAEIFVLIRAGGEFGFWPTFLTCVLTGIIGGFLVKKQGLETIFMGQKALSAGELPLEHLFNGLCIVISGALLVTPGFITDIIGFLFLFQPFRSLIRDKVTKNSSFSVFSMSQGQNTHSSRPDLSGDIIEGEYEEVDEPYEKEAQEKLDS